MESIRGSFAIARSAKFPNCLLRQAPRLRGTCEEENVSGADGLLGHRDRDSVRDQLGNGVKLLERKVKDLHYDKPLRSNVGGSIWSPYVDCDRTDSLHWLLADARKDYMQSRNFRIREVDNLVIDEKEWASARRKGGFDKLLLAQDTHHNAMNLRQGLFRDIERWQQALLCGSSPMLPDDRALFPNDIITTCRHIDAHRTAKRCVELIRGEWENMRCSFESQAEPA
ncbi:uncharacterized protein EI90DRAFT_3016178 [Cantharellus anzutake]|uniref:uncharacterized protein n=1 Tax=Cantharellus anzutake TaxID=1750568 RepID=UPI0019044C74|nr:uncharacterized protein EI90DRAFT_3016178 [Cantharellus anzutake]KAF8332092.1 hypothetical protein EI90DRAFT_3016178 [Cantharellus anzutake]